jgi:hypothetical protein
VTAGVRARARAHATVAARDQSHVTAPRTRTSPGPGRVAGPKSGRRTSRSPAAAAAPRLPPRQSLQSVGRAPRPQVRAGNSYPESSRRVGMHEARERRSPDDVYLFTPV